MHKLAELASLQGLWEPAQSLGHRELRDLDSECLEPLVPRNTALSVVPPTFIGYIHLADLGSYGRTRTTILMTDMTPKEQRSPR
jgi:hypothetical protein